MKKCPECHGVGWVALFNVRESCKVCGGSGEILCDVTGKPIVNSLGEPFPVLMEFLTTKDAKRLNETKWEIYYGEC